MENWDNLKAHKATLDNTRIADLFKADENRFNTFSIQFNNILFDYSKNLVTEDTLTLLTQALKDAHFENWRDRFFLGGAINTTDKRAVLHTALRAPEGTSILVDGHDIMPDIQNVLKRIKTCVGSIRDRHWLGHSDKPIEHIVNIGIGGSKLGTMMVVNALQDHHHSDLTCDFVSNIDGHDIDRILKHYNPETTLFSVASKTFTTQETMMNAKTARNWITEHFGTTDAVKRHFIALSSNVQAVTEFGIAPEHMFEFWDWVGGRYSLWSSIGMPIAIMIGMDRFEDLLEGAQVMDEHFKTAPIAKNIPALMGLIGFWNHSILGYHAQVIAPYDQRLGLLSDWLQQLDMESNGKSVDRNGIPISVSTGSMIMGGAGTDVQHSFFQWLHQGTDPTPTDFIMCAKPDHTHSEHHKVLVTHFLAQQRALMEGHKAKDAPHQGCAGNRPSNALILDQLTPYTLGQLMAAYEHKIFVQGILWNINSFDQYGVELGKTMAKGLQNDWGKDIADYDSSTQGQYAHITARFEVE